ERRKPRPFRERWKPRGSGFSRELLLPPLRRQEEPEPWPPPPSLPLPSQGERPRQELAAEAAPQGLAFVPQPPCGLRCREGGQSMYACVSLFKCTRSASRRNGASSIITCTMPSRIAAFSSLSPRTAA